MELKACMEILKEGIRSELYGAKKLKGEKLDTFKDIFMLDMDDPQIYYNKYNIVITREDVLNALQPYLSNERKTLTIVVDEHNVNLWVYAYFNDRVMKQYLY